MQRSRAQRVKLFLLGQNKPFAGSATVDANTAD